MQQPVFRFAPSPNGLLHAGHAFSALVNERLCRAAEGRLLLRIEDIDTGRARRDVEDGIRRDLEWLGLTWDAETPRQSARTYEAALAALGASVYRCDCTRAQRAASNGRCLRGCRTRGLSEGAVRLALPPGDVVVEDRRWGRVVVDPAAFGDPILVRRDGLVAYNLSVVADDIADGVTEVVRGSDLLEITAVQMRLYEAWGHPPPSWLHAPLVLGADGRKLSKSHGDAHVGVMREAGARPADVWRCVLPWLGLPDCASLEDALPRWRPDAGPRGPVTCGVWGQVS